MKASAKKGAAKKTPAKKKAAPLEPDAEWLCLHNIAIECREFDGVNFEYKFDVF
jgi:hypothetical protein